MDSRRCSLPSIRSIELLRCSSTVEVVGEAQPGEVGVVALVPCRIGSRSMHGLRLHGCCLVLQLVLRSHRLNMAGQAQHRCTNIVSSSFAWHKVPHNSWTYTDGRGEKVRD